MPSSIQKGVFGLALPFPSSFLGFILHEIFAELAQKQVGKGIGVGLGLVRGS